MTVADLKTAQYSTAIDSPAVICRNVGTPNIVPRCTIASRGSGIGEPPTSIPRVIVRPDHGASIRLWFSSQMPIQGKSDAFQRYAKASSARGDKAMKNPVLL